MVSALHLGLDWKNISSKVAGSIAAETVARTARLQTLLFQIFKRNEPDTLLQLAYLRKLDLRNVQEIALAAGRRLKPNRQAHMQLRYAIELLYGSWDSTVPPIKRRLLVSRTV